MIDTFKLKQMLGLYLGARVLVGDEIRVLHGVVGDSMVLIDETYGHLSEYPVTDLGVRIQLLLRPVTSITEAEAMELATVLGWEDVSFYSEMKAGSDEIFGVSVICNDYRGYEFLTVNISDDQVFLHKSLHCFSVIPWFARKGFDLNGWIKSGLGVTKLKKTTKES